MGITNFNCSNCNVNVQSLKVFARDVEIPILEPPGTPNCGAGMNLLSKGFRRAGDYIPVNYLGETIKMSVIGVGINLFDGVSVPGLGYVGRWDFPLNPSGVFIGNSVDVIFPPGTIGNHHDNRLRYIGSQNIGQSNGSDCIGCNFCIRLGFVYVNSCVNCKKQSANVSSTRIVALIDDKNTYHELVDPYTYLQCDVNHPANLQAVNSIRKTIEGIAMANSCTPVTSFSVSIKESFEQPNCVKIDIVDSPVRFRCVVGGGGEYYYFDTTNC